MADLVRDIEAQITGAKAAFTRQSVGTIREIGDGVAKVEGLADVMLNEMIDLGHGITGLALTLDETEVGVIILGDYTQLDEGDECGGRASSCRCPSAEGCSDGS
jgi:F-type H+-transporting ATPase subunit alpha